MKINLLDHKVLNDFPSGSAIEYYNDLIYLIGDDAKDILVLNKRWKEVERIKLFDTQEFRIAKDRKADMESAAIITNDNMPCMLLLGSGSLIPTRCKSFLVNFKSAQIEEHNLERFYERIVSAGVKELNIEATAVLGDKIVFCNRANNTNQVNQLIITGLDFWEKQEETEISILPLELLVEENGVVGVSGLSYSPKNDWLVFSASTEATENAYDDGEIGDSYLGVIENASRKIGRKSMKVNSLINLSKSDKKFKGQKIESLCIQSEKSGRLKMHLTADNDTGTSTLFRVRLKA